MRGTTIVRLVVYGCVLAIALLVWQVRTHHRPQSQVAAKEGPQGAPLLGRTLGQGGSPVTAYVRGGRLSSVALTVRWPCEDVPWDTPVPLTLENEVDGDGRSFMATRKAEYATDARGWQAVLTVRLAGELADDGKRASGTTTMSISWLRNGVVGQTCRPRGQRWEAVRP